MYCYICPYCVKIDKDLYSNRTVVSILYNNEVLKEDTLYGKTAYIDVMYYYLYKHISYYSEDHNLLSYYFFYKSAEQHYNDLINYLSYKEIQVV